MNFELTLKQKIGQFFFPAVFINDSEENILETEALIKEHTIGGLTFFHSRASAATNYESKNKIVFNDDSYDRLKELVNRYQKCAKVPLLISIDAEWGLAMRVEKTPQYPYAITLGALPLSQKCLVYEVGKQIGLDLKSAGVHYNLAPLADVNNNPNNPVIGYRSFGEDKEKVAIFALEYLRGMSDVGVLGCLKHFPGHGNTNVDSHLGLPVLQETLDDLMQNELYPFIKGIENDVDSIMIGHLAVPALNAGKDTSATLSKPIIEELLREKLGYNGLVISDALNMHSVSNLYDEKGRLEWEAFNAGNDVLCFAENVSEGIQQILKNATPERIDESFNRIVRCKEKVGILQSEIENTGGLNFAKASALNTEIAKYCSTQVIDTVDFKTIQKANADQKLAKLSLYKSAENDFFTTINSELNSPEFEISALDTADVETIGNDLKPFEYVIISLFVPKAKPANNFEIDVQIFDLLSKLLLTKKCIIYVFGNPYVLPLIPNLNKAARLIQVYQDFSEFQINAGQQLITNAACSGTLPVKIVLL
ncbi:glycoside hydrolase family 3 protein [Flavobacterium sp. TAB 87]|uniref:glycoside hydrolase family 3 protein n=1 Tax=Flavobacterium sp. TAB 87 TaxID=1729581 RepID=UPI00076D9D98|nr:glycoside hydrolase family 3 N-terminal domain-containing protein [Flavobacterium sp. TAB 87]KVV15475.1 Beta-hexosaminidase A precursor [Flavobacterium sp. TAB 87]